MSQGFVCRSNSAVDYTSDSSDYTVEQLTHIKFRRCSGASANEMKKIGKLSNLVRYRVTNWCFYFGTKS